MHCPNVTVKCHSNDKPWINKKIKVLIHSRRQAFSSGNVTVYKKLRNQVKREIEKGKVNYYADRVRNLQTIEPRKWHQEICTMTRNVKSDLCIPVPGIENSEHGDIANYINDAFVNGKKKLQIYTPRESSYDLVAVCGAIDLEKRPRFTRTTHT